MNNSRTITRLLRRGHSGEDVNELQQLLMQAGFDPGTVDGVFGPGTESAVKAFQASRGLLVDGIVGRQTLAALASSNPQPAPNPSPSPAPGGARGVSLHIGLNHVNPDSYPFPVPVLAGCIKDANDMRNLAQSHGFQNPVILLEAAATAQAVTEAISSAASQLNSGDIFFLTYSGHGSQLVDITGDESDQLDETWVLWNRQLLDDELAALWTKFRPGVRVLLLSDSCHSGTVSRQIFNPPMVRSLDSETAAQLALDLQECTQQQLGQLFASMAGNENRSQRIATNVVTELTQSKLGRMLPLELANFDGSLRRSTYAAAKQGAARAGTTIQCSVLLISGCQDNQTSADGRNNGLFTQRLLEVFSEGNVQGYKDLHNRILRRMPQRQQPNYIMIPDENPTFEGQVPLTI